MRKGPDVTSDRGAIMVFTAVAILVLVAFLVFVLDYGIMWISRAQAQNAADAGALAGAISRAFDETTDPPAAGGLTEQAAQQAAQQNLVWNGAPVAQVSWPCPPGVVGSCVRVDVYRNGQFGSTPLPMLFGPVLNITSQGVRATATARVASGNTTECMRPFSVADRWDHVVNPLEAFNRWERVGSAAVENSPHDNYVPPGATGPGTGYTVAAHQGTQLVLKAGNNPNSDVGAISPGWTLPVRLPDGAGGYLSGANPYSEAIKQCIGNPVSIGQYLPLESGVMVGPTNQGVETDGGTSPSLINQDPDAEYDPGTNTITGSCAPSCAPQSPRIVPISVFDMDEFQWRRAANNWTSPWTDGNGVTHPANPCPTGGRCVRVVNILGFFVEGMTSQDVVGRLMTVPGIFSSGSPTVGGGAGFLFNIQLVR